MNLSPLVKKIFTVLFVLNILLLFANILIPKIFKTSGEKEKVELSSKEINKRFKSSLHQFNLGDEWIKKQKGNNPQFIYNVDVPKDLPIPLLIREIAGSFDTSEVQITSKELKVRGITEVRIKSNNEEKLFASFNYNDKINRRSAEVGFIILAPELTEKNKEEFIKLPEKFLLLIIPSKENAVFVKKLKTSGKEYALLLNDDTKDLDFKLSPKYSQERLKISVKAMLGTFNDAVCYFYDPSSNLYSSQAFMYEKSELSKRNIKLIDYRSIPVIEGGDYKDKLKESIAGFKQDEKKLILISSEDYFNALPEITQLWKKGYKFINPSIILKQL